jgi:hypothetical protein
MTAVDNNVLVYLLTGDDSRQAAAARSLFWDRADLDRQNGIARNGLGAPQPIRIR